MPDLLTAPPLFPQVALPQDRGLPEFSRLFDGEWVWRTYCSLLGQPETRPQRLRLRQLSYNPGRRVVATCVAEWLSDEFVTQDQFAIELAPDQPARLFRYPEDPYLPGLTGAASAVVASRLLNRYVFAAPVQRVRVRVVRYRPGGHAVLRHRLGRVRFYVRVMRPERVSRLMAAAELVAQSGFALPRLAGCWTEGGVVWLSEIPGTNVRRLIRKGDALDPALILDGLARLWDIPYQPNEHRPFSLRGAYRRARRVFRQVLRDRDGPRRTLKRATAALDPFVTSWQPSGVAHNDFYDDQLIRIPDGRLALVDFEGGRTGRSSARCGQLPGPSALVGSFRAANPKRRPVTPIIAACAPPRWSVSAGKSEHLTCVRPSASSEYAPIPFAISRPTGRADWRRACCWSTSCWHSHPAR